MILTIPNKNNNKMSKYSIIVIFLLHFGLNAQKTPFDLLISPFEVQGVGGLQAFSYGQSEGKWLIIGGRLDGLQRRQPFASFDIAGHNNRLTVVDPVNNQSWTSSLDGLQANIKEQLSSTNMESIQEGNTLYLIGGYGYSETQGDHTTFPFLTAIDVKGVIQAIINDQPISAHIRQIKDDKFAVTGGYLHKIYDHFYLIGGQKFIGRYNPMGPTHGPGFIQEYTNAIRKFVLRDEGQKLEVTHLPEIVNKALFHRRDYNVAPQIMPNGQEGLTAFSGVFQENVDLPYLTCVNIDTTHYAIQPEFNQYYNHYHCAHVPLYSASGNEMHTLFFGGIAQYYEENGLLVKDDNVPFVKTIARVTRKQGGSMAEYKLPIEMPGYLGAGSEFIPTPEMPMYPNGVIQLDQLSNDTTLIGYIYGGISSSAPNIFFDNTGIESIANNQLFKVFLIRTEDTGLHEVNPQSQNGLGLTIYPNPGKEIVQLKFNLPQTSDCTLQILDLNGKILHTMSWHQLNEGEHQYSTMSKFENEHVLIFQLKAGQRVSSQKVIIN